MDINMPMVLFVLKVMQLFQEEKVEAYVTDSVPDLLDRIYKWQGGLSPSIDLKFWRAVAAESRTLSNSLIVGTITYNVVQVLRELCRGILASEAMHRSVWVSNIVDQILGVVGDVCIQELHATKGPTILEETDAVMSLVALAQKRAAIKLLKTGLPALMFAYSSE